MPVFRIEDEPPAWGEVERVEIVRLRRIRSSAVPRRRSCLWGRGQASQPSARRRRSRKLHIIYFVSEELGRSVDDIQALYLMERGPG